MDVYLPKSLVSDVSNLKVTVDGEQVAFTSESQGDSWQLSFTYHHSTHQVNINLNSAQANLPSQSEQWPIYVSVIAVAVAAAAVALGIWKIKQVLD